jgi:hypothetical protein
MFLDVIPCKFYIFYWQKQALIICNCMPSRTNFSDKKEVFFKIVFQGRTSIPDISLKLF